SPPGPRRPRLNAATGPETTAGPPWTWNSAVSSPVKLAGAGNHSTRPRSTSEPSDGSRNGRRVATRGSRRPPASRAVSAPAAGPDRRTTATPARPRPEAWAKIVVADMFRIVPFHNAHESNPSRAPWLEKPASPLDSHDGPDRSEIPCLTTSYIARPAPNSCSTRTTP